MVERPIASRLPKAVISSPSKTGLLSSNPSGFLSPDYGGHSASQGDAQDTATETSAEGGAELGNFLQATRSKSKKGFVGSASSSGGDSASNPYFSLNRSLQRAINEGKKHVVKVVLQEFPKSQVVASINEWNESGYAPIHIAAIEGYEQIIKLLVANGADPNLYTKDEETPVFLASTWFFFPLFLNFEISVFPFVVLLL